MSGPCESVRLKPRVDSKGVGLAVLTAFDSDNIWLVNQSELEKLEEFGEKLHKEYTQMEGNTECIPSNPGMEKGKYYVMKWETDGKYYRVINEGDSTTARLVDYGNMAVVDYQYVFDLKEEFSHHQFSRKCISTGSFSEDLGTLLQDQKLLKIMFRRPKFSEFGENWLVEEVAEQSHSPVLAEKKAENSLSAHSQMEAFENRPCRLEFVDPIRCLTYIAFDDEDVKRNQIQARIYEKAILPFALVFTIFGLSIRYKLSFFISYHEF